ncbi:DUF6069 family protein [Agromyces sp. H3Y2-19a]|uniref:DUF6069 family protein n=1 Tax=Agromyces chromiiresistens TaxID=3030835 RepID=UPI0023B9E856|nr:DUF6069 family protein [Agromyces chromiiresistens]MDF0514278.1 DUF6069 family protein [Agromyces chromiiresistens]
MNTTAPAVQPNAVADRIGVDAPPSRRRLARAATVAVAIVLPLIVWVFAVPLAGLDLVAGSGTTAQTITPVSIVVAGLFAGLAAWGFLALLERFTRLSARIFGIVGWTMLALSLLGPIGAGGSGAVIVALIAMHLVTGATLMVGLPIAARRRPTATEL